MSSQNCASSFALGERPPVDRGHSINLFMNPKNRAFDFCDSKEAWRAWGNIPPNVVLCDIMVHPDGCNKLPDCCEISDGGKCKSKAGTNHCIISNTQEDGNDWCA